MPLRTKEKTVSKKRPPPVKSQKIKSKAFPVVAIGASAGGLEAFSSLLKHLPGNTGMAFIYVQHLSPDHRSLLTSILSKVTKMKVQEIDDMELIEPDNVYIIPPDKGIEVMDGHIKLLPRSKSITSVSIDVLFSTLALTHKANVIGVILSGYGRDGTKGLQSIKEAGGVTFAQDDSAQAGSMPKSVIATGAVDFVLSPPKIARELVRLSKNDFGIKKTSSHSTPFFISDSDRWLKTILEILHKEVRVDFGRYKMSTIKRRINHRMIQCEVKTIKEYAKLLLKNRNEIEILYKDLLINVTSFFRDPEVFKYLETVFLPDLLRAKESAGGGLRIWVPACSTGEEAYSIAMLLSEIQENRTKKIPVQIFATDLSEQAIRDARIGEYSQSDLEPVSKTRRERFFIKDGDKYKISKELRQMCIFAPHNILRDPPFSHIDFVSCRNLLIYFEVVAQKKALATLNFALNEEGYLMLGKSETVGMSSQFFTQIDNKFKIYIRKKTAGARKIPELTPRSATNPAPGKNTKFASKKRSDSTSAVLDNVIDSTLVKGYMPACAIINKDMEILKFRGSTSLYLSHRQGNASLNILKMIRPEFAFELRSAIQEALKTKAPVRKHGIELDTEIIGATSRVMSLDVCPLKIEWDEPLLLIVFTEEHIIEKYIDGQDSKSDSLRKAYKFKRQTKEITKVRAEMHAVIEAQERAYEELQAANEEIISTSEEFQTLNEELETSKEEIEATNEELTTTNQELQMRNEQLGEAYDFSKAITATMHEPILILDKHHRIKSANHAFYKYFMALQADTEGKLLYELGNHQWDIPRLHQLLSNIIQKDTYFYDYEITHIFPHIGKKTMLLNAARIVQKTQNDQLILLTFIDATQRTLRQKGEKKNLEDIITERTAALQHSYDLLDKKNISLKKMNEELETFTFISSHDLQEPLRKIKTFATCLLQEEKEKLSDSGKDYLKRMEDTVNRMHLLIEDLLTYSRVKNKEAKLEKTDLGEVAKEVIAEFDEMIKEKKAEIKVEPLCRANIIRFQFRQLFQNLISNSLKFSHPKRFPRIIIKSKISKGSILKMEGISPQKNYCHISFIDNGIGFDPQYKERIFEVFQRLHGYDAYKGTGIGLAICKRIVENHNGIITATSKLNKGAQFDIYIPTGSK